jgi:hypothetical protein
MRFSNLMLDSIHGLDRRNKQVADIEDICTKT